MILNLVIGDNKMRNHITGLSFKMMKQVIRMFDRIEMLSDKKSFSIGVYRSAESLWILNHFKEIEIKNHKILYQINRGIRQRKSTKYPISRLYKKFKSTNALIYYLLYKPYDILCFELEFKNGWKIKMGTYIDMTFYTNSSDDRNQLIKKLFSIEGTKIDSKKLNEMEYNISYYVEINGEMTKGKIKLPDEFWTKEEVNEWRKNEWKKFNN